MHRGLTPQQVAIAVTVLERDLKNSLPTGILTCPVCGKRIYYLRMKLMYSAVCETPYCVNFAWEPRDLEQDRWKLS